MTCIPICPGLPAPGTLSALLIAAGGPAAAGLAGDGDDSTLIARMIAGMNWIDLVLLLGLASGLLVGIGVGFYRQVAIFTSLAVGLVAAARLAEPIAASESFRPIRESLALDPGASRLVAFSLVVWTALVLGLLLCLLFHSFFSKQVRFLDGLLGGAMGVAISGLLFGLLLLGIFQSDLTRLDAPIRASRLGSRLAEGARVVAAIFPEDIQARFDARLEADPPDDRHGPAQ